MMNENPKVSFIIPCYNVEPYIEKCINSITRQTISEIEIIPVDDGSPDGTGKILDRLAEKDPRIKVIHKENAGVSAARNSGLQLAIGDYIVFVDGDDFIAEDYAEYMLTLINQTGADVFVSTKHYNSKYEEPTKQESYKVLNREDAIALMVSPDMIVYSPNKMIKRSLIEENGLRFSTNLFYGEGLTFCTNLAKVAERVCIGNRKVYFYRRNNVASATTAYNIDKILNGEKALILLKDELDMSSKLIRTTWTMHLCNYYVGAIVREIGSGKKNEHMDHYKRWKRFLRDHFTEMMLSNHVRLYRKGLIIGGLFAPRLLSIVDKRRRNKILNSEIE